MTKSFKNSRNKKIIALCLSTFMLTAAVSLAGCKRTSTNDKDSDYEEITRPETDKSRIKNGSFEFFDDNDGKNLIITSPTGWSKSAGSSASNGTASSSKASSGIVNTNAESWKQLAESSGLDHKTKADAEKNWDNLTAKDRLEFYKTWKDEDDNNKLSDLSFYDKDKHNYNIDFESAPNCKNPLTHDYVAESTEENKDTNVLMIHNSYTDGRGTAQKYSSSSDIKLAPGTSAEVSLWVKTSDMTFLDTAGTPQNVINERGAYIEISQTIGGTTLDKMQIKNINTENITENNGWLQYTFLLKGSSYSETTFKMVLGLGQGGGSDKFEYVEGYAFFDDVNCKIISNEEFDSSVADVADNAKIDLSTEADKKELRADTGAYNNIYKYAIDLYSSFTDLSLDSKFETALTQEKSGGKIYVSGEDGNPDTEIYGDLKLSTDKDIAKYLTIDELNANDNIYLNKIKKDFNKEKYPFTDEKILLLMSADGASYTSSMKKADPFTLEKDSYMLVSFWLKTSDISGFTGAGITLKETKGNNSVALSSLNTTTITKVDIDGPNGTLKEDIYDGWQQCFFFVENTTKETQNFYLEFTYGPTSIVGTNNSSYYAGYAAFANFETAELTEKEFRLASTGTYSKTASLKGDEMDISEQSGFDIPSTIPHNAIKEGLANPKNFKGVNGGSGYVVPGATDKNVDAYSYAGLVNKKYADNYKSNITNDYWLKKLADSANVNTAEEGWWNEIFGTATQPLVIYNNEKMSYGYIGNSQTIASNSYATVSVKVKVSAGATANIFLIDTTKNDFSETLSINTPSISFWYDDEGNVCDMDPSDKNFKKKNNIAFYLNSKNGLYEANKNWTGYTEELKDRFFANLSNYEIDKDTGNLLISENGVSYNYDKTAHQHEGNDGIAFYAKEGKYYAHSDYTVEVSNLADVANLTPRFKNGDKSFDTMMTVTDTNGEWVTCTFYVHTGNAEKKYRLEVWSGDRLGNTDKASEAGSYVIFDTNKPDNVDSTYSALLKETVEMIKKDNNNWSDEDFKANYENALHYAYSFYDSNSFLRYDSTIDKDNVGNSYKNYKSSAYAEGISYLFYSDNKTAINNTLNTMFVDYSLTDVKIATDVSEDNDNNDDKPVEPVDQSNTALFIVSLIIAVTLILAVISLLVRMFIKKHHIGKHKSETVETTDTGRRRYNVAKKAKKETKEEEVKEEPKDENNPYND